MQLQRIYPRNIVKDCRKLMCLLQMPFENIASVSTVESNYFFAKPN